MSTIDAGGFQALDVHCRAGYKAIAGGITSNSAVVFLNEESFDPNDPTHLLLAATNLGDTAAQWAGVVTCAG